MDLTLPLNALMWATGIAAVFLTLNCVWAIAKTRRPAPLRWNDVASQQGASAWSASSERRGKAVENIHSIHASVQRLEAALNDITRIERDLRRSQAASSLEIAVTVAALKMVVKINRVRLDGTELRVEFDPSAKVSQTQINEALSWSQ